ncbi:MAG: hypothetical protein V1668_02495 [Patescibacteria group bacterium]
MNAQTTLVSPNELKDSALSVKARLDGYQVGFGEDRRFMSLVSPAPYLISTDDHQTLKKRGHVIRQWVETTNRLYHASLTDPSLFWLRDLLETGLNDEMRAIHRQLHAKQPMRAPFFMRMDQPTFTCAAEAQTPGSGWGYHAALATCYEEYTVLGRSFVARVAHTLRELTGKDRPRVVHLLHKVDYYGTEATFFAQAIRAAGIDFTISVRTIPENIKTYDVVFRHYLEELGQYSGWQNLLGLYDRGGIEIEPAPNIITDHKISMMLPFHPRTFMYYSDAVRSIFPATYLVDPYATYQMRISNNYAHPVRLSNLPGIPPKQRRLTLKYAGMDPQKRAGGRGVFNLSMSDEAEINRLLQQVIDDTYNGIPWLLQEMVLRRYPVTYLSAEGAIANDQWYARINPFYAFPASGGSELLGCPVHFRNFWKVHGQPDAVETIMAIA